MQFLQKQYNQLLDDYTKLALYSMFEVKALKSMFLDENMKKIPSLLEEIKEGGENLGIIVKIVDEKPIFIHETFAEYFIANHIWEKLKSIPQLETEDFIKNVIKKCKNISHSRKTQLPNFLQSIAKQKLNNNIRFEDKDFRIEAKLLLNIVESAL